MRVSLLGSARLACAGSALVLLCGCFRGPARSSAGPAPRPQPAAEARTTLPRLGYSIQAGAFARVENAVRLAETLQGLGLNATFYASAPEGSEHRLYRVRFGDFPSRDAALVKGEALRADGVIQAFYIVAPEEPPLPRLSPGDEAGLRTNLVETATNYVGIPYLWGGATEAGFDCSGLAMAVYRLNGLQLPRSSREQYARGEPVPLDRLRKGDLLFFATGGGTAVTHVGIYTGGESFIHAPKRGRRIGSDRLEGYYRQHLVGARSYLS
jgi:cell wall-associated NlpC family hydrolase